jgi:hypothetical protein
MPPLPLPLLNYPNMPFLLYSPLEYLVCTLCFHLRIVLFVFSIVVVVVGMAKTGLSEEEGREGRGSSDLVVFRDLCTPAEQWPWAKWMPEGWTNLTTPGLGLET